MQSYQTKCALLNAVKSAIPVFGRFLVVCSPSDTGLSHYQDLQETFDVEDGRVRFFTTVQAAYDEAQDGNNDVICIDGKTAHSVAAMITVSKSRVHFFGFDGGGRLCTQGAHIVMGVTGVNTDLAPIKNVGVRNSFRNIKCENASTTDASLYGFIEAGEGTLIENCQTLKTVGLDDANHAHFWLGSDSATIRNLTVGQSNTPNTAAGFGILIKGVTDGAAGGVVKENILENIRINMSVGGAVQATSCFIKVDSISAMNFINSIKGLECHNFIPVGGSAMTDAILAPGSIVAGSLDITGEAFFGCTGVSNNASAGVRHALPGAVAVTAGGICANVTD